MMIATGSTLGCGMSLLVAVWGADADAGHKVAPQVHRFGDTVIVVQPGPAAAPVLTTKPAAPARTPVQFAKFTTDVGQPPGLPFDGDTPKVTEHADDPSPPAMNGLDMAKRYREIYNAIPFDRSEYEANPSYRHEAAMEILFGKMRPTVIHRNYSEIDVNLPQTPFMPAPYSPYGFNSYFFPFFSPGYRVHRSF